jgi:hypothetical protein
MTFNQLVQDFCRRTNFNTAPTHEIRERAEAFLNETLQEMVSEPGVSQWIARHEPDLTFASVANQWAYGLKGSAGRIVGVRDRTTQITLEMMSEDDWRRHAPNPTIFLGLPSFWVPYGTVAVAVQPSAADSIFFKSTSASDVQTAFIEGVRTGGYPWRAQITLTGVTGVNADSTTTDVVEITKVYLSSPAAGTVTVLQTSGSGTELARIPIGETQTFYQGVILYPTPQSAITYYVDSERELSRMIHATDIPVLPPQFHRVLVDGALWREYEKRSDEREPQALNRYKKGLSNLRYFVTCPPDFLPSHRGRTERSRLGGYYPADSI